MENVVAEEKIPTITESVKERFVEVEVIPKGANPVVFIFKDEQGNEKQIAMSVNLAYKLLSASF